jgi:hypothetical protein
MAIELRPARRPRDREKVNYVTQKQGMEILDRQARKYLGMSGSEFLRQYRSGQIENPDRSEVARVAMLIPLAQAE